MITSYSQESSIEQAFRETFGGDRPCELCRLIDTVEEPDSETPLNAPDKSNYKNLKLMLGLEREVIVPAPRSWTSNTVFDPFRYEKVTHSVPTPPPRSLV